MQTNGVRALTPRGGKTDASGSCTHGRGDCDGGGRGVVCERRDLVGLSASTIQSIARTVSGGTREGPSVNLSEFRAEKCIVVVWVRGRVGSCGSLLYK